MTETPIPGAVSAPPLFEELSVGDKLYLPEAWGETFWIKVEDTSKGYIDYSTSISPKACGHSGWTKIVYEGHASKMFVVKGMMEYDPNQQGDLDEDI